ncbi:hypothetical protein G7075_06975 [Phycicoccus sp. HDW14]|uniref:hypothetical protein n=1 Tax=Phycicoccus sp. HDW14 TaxID=2714941 RepID=UPI00140C2DDD|nr:hypothetical protein [Phycicoccus sp. HDW14]QIM20932.1 hypothetical protein G7075_06975 [Phycicoccus sp. HDW14]
MSIHADQLFVTAEVERRLELAGVDVHHPRRRHDQGAEETRVGTGVHPFAAVVARLVRPRATGRPRHP